MADPEISCIVGLGNPGQRYADTRHNAGYWFADEVAREFGGRFRGEAKFFGEICRVAIAGRDCWILKPTTFMNRSGQSVSAFARFYKILPESLLVAHDELDLTPGTAKLKRGGGHGGHTGLRDLMSAIGGSNFLRLRAGIGHPGHRDQVVDYVLNRPTKTEESEIRSALADVLAILPSVVCGELQKAMNELHR